uniref:Uncharacterized protein n=1 Tax=Oryza brachyantha TaxID=4533 RepID=J3LXN1_ORYBR
MAGSAAFSSIRSSAFFSAFSPLYYLLHFLICTLLVTDPVVICTSAHLTYNFQADVVVSFEVTSLEAGERLDPAMEYDAQRLCSAERRREGRRGAVRPVGARLRRLRGEDRRVLQDVQGGARRRQAHHAHVCTYRLPPST